MWTGTFLTVVFRPSLAHHVLDTGSSAPALAIGCLLESFRIAASVHGLSTQFTFSGLPQREGPCAELHFIEDGAPADKLSDALPKRTTDRRLYRRGPIPTKEVAEVWDTFDEKTAARVDCTASLPHDLMDFMLDAESLVGTHSSIFPDTLPWIRFTQQELARTQDGLPWRGTGISTGEFPALYLMRSFPRTFQLFRKAGMGAIQRARIKRLLQSSAGLLCLSTAGDGVPALLTVGRLAMRLWLRLTQMGYGVQPLTISSLLMYNAKRGMLDPETQRLFGARYAAGEVLLRRDCAIPAHAEPVWLWRIGISDPLPASWLTPRRDVESTLDVVT